jgi:hypothetical protein
MDIGIIGSSIVAQTLGGRLARLGHGVMISSRDPDAAKDLGQRGVLPSANQWAADQRSQGRTAAAGSFADAAAYGEVIINATAGTVALAAVGAADEADLEGKILVDVSNPLDFSGGMPPTLAVCNTDSIGERLQAAHPGARVVKTLNTVNCAVMVDPAQLGEETDQFVAGDDPDAKAWVSEHLLRHWLGWTRVRDLGDISAARALEMYLPLWLRLLAATGSASLNVRVVVAGETR